jgi:hypothetical protein
MIRFRAKRGLSSRVRGWRRDPISKGLTDPASERSVLGVPLPLVPMAPTLVRPPFHRDGWVYEHPTRFASQPCDRMHQARRRAAQDTLIGV